MCLHYVLKEEVSDLQPSKDSSVVLMMRLSSISACIERIKSLLKAELDGLGENRSTQDVFDSNRCNL